MEFTKELQDYQKEKMNSFNVAIAGNKVHLANCEDAIKRQEQILSELDYYDKSKPEMELRHKQRMREFYIESISRSEKAYFRFKKMDAEAVG